MGAPVTSPEPTPAAKLAEQGQRRKALRSDEIAELVGRAEGVKLQQKMAPGYVGTRDSAIQWVNDALRVLAALSTPEPAGEVEGETVRAALERAIGFLETCAEVFDKRQPQDAEARRNRAGIIREWVGRLRPVLTARPSAKPEVGLDVIDRFSRILAAVPPGNETMPVFVQDVRAVLAALNKERV